MFAPGGRTGATPTRSGPLLRMGDTLADRDTEYRNSNPHIQKTRHPTAVAGGAKRSLKVHPYHRGKEANTKMEKYIASKPCSFGGRRYNIGEVIEAGAVDPNRAKALIRYGTIRPAGDEKVNEAPANPEEKKQSRRKKVE